MDKADLVYRLLSYIPDGYVLTYGQIASFLNLGSNRLVGRILHNNPEPENIDCYKVIFSDGKLAPGFAFGGENAQKHLLIQSGVEVINNKVNLLSYRFELTELFSKFFDLYKLHGDPGPWPWIIGEDPMYQNGVRYMAGHTKDEIIIGAILTQNTNWKNVQKALANLRNSKVNSIDKIYKLAKDDISKLEELIRPSGFYKQKAKCLYDFTKLIIEKYKTLENVHTKDLSTLREEFLTVKRVGQETADTILLYAFDKPTFIIDAYTRKYLKSLGAEFASRADDDYIDLKNFIEAQLPLNHKLFQDFHALIIIDAKRRPKLKQV